MMKRPAPVDTHATHAPSAIPAQLFLPELAVDNVRFVTAGTVVFIAFLVPEMLQRNLDVVPVLFFVVVATLNHMFPQRLQRLTHIVKAAWSWVLFTYIGDALAEQHPDAFSAVAAIVPPTTLMAANIVGSAAVALLPDPRSWAAVTLELLNVVPRHALMGLAFAGLRGFSVITTATCVGLLVLYREERRERLQSGMRYAYGYTHSAEHVNIVLFLSAAMELRFPLFECVAFTLATIVAAIVIVVASNQFIYWRANRNPERMPQYIRHELHAVFFAKLRKNAFSLKWHNYIAKPFGHALSSRFGSWAWLESMVRRLRRHPELDAAADSAVPATINSDDFDMIIGIITGGAFVACAIAEHCGIKHVAFVRSKLYSGQGARSGVLLAFSNVSVPLALRIEKVLDVVFPAGKDQSSAAVFTPQLAHEGIQEAVDACCAARGKSRSQLRVLLVDDTLMSGRTLRNARDKLCQVLRMSVGQFCTAVLVAHPQSTMRPDYVAGIGAVPLVWEWGAEID